MHSLSWRVLQHPPHDVSSFFAAVLGFVHPVTGAALSFEAPLPEDMAGLVSALGG